MKLQEFDTEVKLLTIGKLSILDTSSSAQMLKFLKNNQMLSMQNALR